MSDIIYIAKFNLTLPVNDFEAAEEYLNREDMTQFAPDDIKPKLEKVEWHMRDDMSGDITVKANAELTDKESAELSEWIQGQCSDGLGEGFEQQSFAEWFVDIYGDEHNPSETYTDDVDGDWEYASFDWGSNEYELIRQ